MMDLRFPDICIALFCESQSTINLEENHKVSELSMHIDIYYYGIRELVHNRTFSLMYIPMINNLADIYTKRLSKIQLSKLYRIALGHT
jgi:hypothetical protein